MEHIDRQAARLLVVTPEEQILLLRLEPSFREPFWVTPGGGLDEGETFMDAARRELREEVGRDDLPIGPASGDGRSPSPGRHGASTRRNARSSSRPRRRSTPSPSIRTRNRSRDRPGSPSRTSGSFPRSCIRSVSRSTSNISSCTACRTSRSIWATSSRTDVSVAVATVTSMHLRVIEGWLVAFPETRTERRRGLLGRGHVGAREAVVFANCRSVHTIGMRASIDVVVLDRDWQVVRIVSAPPGHVVLPRPGARHIVEVAAGCGPAFSRSLDGRTIRDALRSVRPARTEAAAPRRTRPGWGRRRSA